MRLHRVVVAIGVRRAGVLGAIVASAIFSMTGSSAAVSPGAASPAAPSVSQPAATHGPAPSLAVVRAWSRATAPGAPVAVVYFEIQNPGPEDRLMAIECACAQRVEMHSTATVNGLMQMREVATVEVPAAGRVVFGPGALHAMLMDLKAPLEEGERLPLTLVFQHAGRVRIEAQVEGLGAMGPTAHGEPPPPSYRLARWPQGAASPAFDLVDFDGRARTLADYRGHVLVVFFGFVRCPDACPAELYKLERVMRRLGPAARHVRVLFVTLDPKHDSLAILKSYLTAFDPRFIGLSGTPAQIDRAASTFHVEYARVAEGAGYTIDHSTSTFLFDAAGQLRLVGALNTSIDDLAHDLGSLTAE